jgi:hypothetical protein
MCQTTRQAKPDTLNGPFEWRTDPQLPRSGCTRSSARRVRLSIEAATKRQPSWLNLSKSGLSAAKRAERRQSGFALAAPTEADTLVTIRRAACVTTHR